MRHQKPGRPCHPVGLLPPAAHHHHRLLMRALMIGATDDDAGGARFKATTTLLSFLLYRASADDGLHMDISGDDDDDQVLMLPMMGYGTNDVDVCVLCVVGLCATTMAGGWGVGGGGGGEIDDVNCLGVYMYGGVKHTITHRIQYSIAVMMSYKAAIWRVIVVFSNKESFCSFTHK